MESVVVAAENAIFESIDGVLFDKTTHTLLLYPPVKKETAYTIPEGTESIAASAFYSSKLSEIVIPGSMKVIGGNAFLFCENLKEIVLPEGVEELSSYAFQYCTKLERIVLPDSLVSVGSSIFLHCEKLTEIVLSENHPALTLICGCLIERETMRLIACPMGIRETTLEFPDGIRIVERNAFKKCKNLEEIVFGEGLVSIRDSAFDGCTGLKRIVLPASVAEIDKSAFDPNKLKNTVFVVTPGSYAEEFCTANGLKIENP